MYQVNGLAMISTKKDDRNNGEEIRWNGQGKIEGRSVPHFEILGNQKTLP
jgi:hypothetical protein